MKRLSLLAIAWLAGANVAPVFASAPTVAACNLPESHTVLASSTSSAADARAYWLDDTTLQWPGVSREGRFGLLPAGAAEQGNPVSLSTDTTPLPEALTAKFRFVADGPRLRVPGGTDVATLLRNGVRLVHFADDGRELDSTFVQLPGALDALYGEKADKLALGAKVADDDVSFTIWAPTARNVALCTYASPTSDATALHPMQRDADTGAWRATTPTDIGPYYLYLVDVYVPGTGLIRNRVTDPYSVALAANGTRSLVADLDAAETKPEGWGKHAQPKAIEANTDLSIYELHVRDFSRDDATVPAAHRGKYLAFTDAESNGMRHLRGLAKAGMTDVHLLPVFDFATVPERDCDPDGDAAHDCFNWGYDPAHFNAPEGSYASEPDGVARIVEFRRMVQALHAAGLRVGMDVVYNHTHAAGQAAGAVLDRIVPGYYHRLDEKGAVTTSTCCANTATEHRMMAKLMRDSVVLWATHYGIDSFRFDLMGHQPRAAMEDLQRALKAATGQDVPLIGEGWNFGEVADGKRFVQASQLSLAGSGIATFSDRARDAVRGGGPGDHLPALTDARGWATGASDAHLADLVRVGLAGTLKDYTFVAADGVRKPSSAVDYKGQPAGYAATPGEVVNYVENHDNQTFFDIGALKLPRDTSKHDRARMQLLAAATTAFSQGTAYYHAGLDVLRSKSLDRNSFDSGDQFNRLDWTYHNNHFGAGLPPPADNAADYDATRPLLADAAHIKSDPADIAWMRDAFRDLLRIRASSPLFRMRTLDDVQARLTFPASPDPRVVIGRIDGSAFPDANFGGVQYFLNADTAPHTIDLPASRGDAWSLHPVHANGADARARKATFDANRGRFTIPARTAVVFVLPQEPNVLPPLITTTLPARLGAEEESIRIDVQLPPHYDPTASAAYPVLYLNDGQDLEAVDLRETLAKAYRDDAIHPLILVAIHMPKDRMAGYGLSDRAAGTSVIAPTKYGPVGTNAHAYSQWVAETLVPWIDAHYDTVERRDGRTILGWSLGGLNAFDLAWQYPGVFGRFGAFSPSFWLSKDTTDVAAVQRTRLAQSIVDAGPPRAGLQAYLAVGTAEETDDRDGDGTIDVIDDARDLAARIPGAKVVLLEGGQHRQPSWAAMLPAFVQWAFGKPDAR